MKIYMLFIYLIKNAPNPLVFIEIVIMKVKSVDLYHASRCIFTFIIQYVIYTLIMVCFEI